ncbi:hypothetical protein DAEQUDRAFT_412828 [Daedalea quercina L-15889]|uniref:Uncharacterized protein n=1 Tax=Daedalea quercina L-15889 TaxID=1314783 RepID=A0A165NLU5_9APHY|nr:hypothetical protein DAEQUDRAFT_412828 [Daedalea quercina L-15889]
MEQSIYPHSSVLGEPRSLERYTKNDPWSTPVGTAPGFLAPSTPSSSASSSSLTLDEDVWGEGDTSKCDHNALKLVDQPDSDATLSTTKAASHSEWLDQFAEQARRAHLRNVSRSIVASSFVHAAFHPLDDDPIYPDVAHETPEPLLLQVKQPWLSAFRRGCVTVDGKARKMYAQSVVALGAWDADALAELANRVVDRISESYGEGFAVLAPFVQDIVRCLAADVGEAEADWFRNLLREFLLAEFTAWWDMRCCGTSSTGTSTGYSTSPSRSRPLWATHSRTASSRQVRCTTASRSSSGSFPHWSRFRRRTRSSRTRTGRSVTGGR